MTHQFLEDNYFIIGIDGGASKTEGVIFTQTGQLLASIQGNGTSLTANEEPAPERIRHMILMLCAKAGISTDFVDAVGLGLAGASNQRARDMLFKEIDGLKLSRKTLIASDAEAAFEVGCPGNEGVLLSVGTGVIALGRGKNGKTFRSGGLGLEKDVGSGYWIGKEALLKIAIEENNLFGDQELLALSEVICRHAGENAFDISVEKIMESDEKIQKIAALAKAVIQLAENNNNQAIAIVQEATLGVSELLLELTGAMELEKDYFLIAGNGSILRNTLYRKFLTDTLRFHFPKVNWTFSSISPAFGAGLLASRFRDIPVTLQSIVQQNNENNSYS